jgi:hypothetical protein
MGNLEMSQRSIDDHRKFALRVILAPYLIEVKKLFYGEGSNIITEWLDKCNRIERLDFNANSKIREGLNEVLKKGYFPISFDKLKTECNELYCYLEDGKKNV